MEDKKIIVFIRLSHGLQMSSGAARRLLDLSFKLDTLAGGAKNIAVFAPKTEAVNGFLTDMRETLGNEDLEVTEIPRLFYTNPCDYALHKKEALEKLKTSNMVICVVESRQGPIEGGFDVYHVEVPSGSAPDEVASFGVELAFTELIVP